MYLHFSLASPCPYFYPALYFIALSFPQLSITCSLPCIPFQPVPHIQPSHASALNTTHYSVDFTGHRSGAKHTLSSTQTEAASREHATETGLCSPTCNRNHTMIQCHPCLPFLSHIHSIKHPSSLIPFLTLPSTPLPSAFPPLSLPFPCSLSDSIPFPPLSTYVPCLTPPPSSPNLLCAVVGAIRKEAPIPDR